MALRHSPCDGPARIAVGRSVWAAVSLIVPLALALPASAWEQELVGQGEHQALVRQLDQLGKDPATPRSFVDHLPAVHAAYRQPAGGPTAPAEMPEEMPDNRRIIDFEKRIAAMEAAGVKKFPNVQVNGAFQTDVGYFDQDEISRLSVGDVQDGADFRRTRLSASGMAQENINYFVQMDFGFFGRPTFTDVWAEISHLPILGNVRIGQWKQPFSLEVVSSFRYTTFAERSLLFQSIAPFRHIGVGFWNYAQDQMATWAASVFRTGQDQFGGDLGDSGGVSMAARVTRLLYYNEPASGPYYLHVGGAYSFGDPSNNLTQLATIPEVFIGSVGTGFVGTSQVPVNGPANGTPPFVNTGAIPTVNFSKFGTELLWVNGPFSFQSEAMCEIVNQQNGPSLFFPGMYMQAGYFLTGEHRPYYKMMGAVDRVVPLENFFRVRDGKRFATGRGAWELAARWSVLDLNDKNVRGGRLNDITTGVNWYLNPYSKFQFNWVVAFLDNPTFGNSTTNIFDLRFQQDF